MNGRRRRRLMMLAALTLALAGVVDPGGGQPAPQLPMGQAVVLVRAVPAGRRITAADLGLVRLPTNALARAQITDPAAVVGRPPAIDLPAGTPLSAGLVAARSRATSREVAIRLDGLAGVPAGAAGGGVADLYVTSPGPRPTTSAVLRDVWVVVASAGGGEASATLRVPPRAVRDVIAAEAAGALRLVMHGGAG
jgi:Flp pilus assembly protein CpaB